MASKRRRGWLIASVVAMALVSQVAVAWAVSSRFVDVSPSSPFAQDIEWLAETGVTKGCNPPANTEFCPRDQVTREQMAAFMHRLAVNQVVDAATVQGLEPAELKGDPGPQGPKGDIGPQGPAGAGIVTGFYQKAEVRSISTESAQMVVLSCDVGDYATGGGVFLDTNDPDFVVVQDGPTPAFPNPPTAWQVSVALRRDLPVGGNDYEFTVKVVCADTD